jgi:Predicted oxidoreductase
MPTPYIRPYQFEWAHLLGLSNSIKRRRLRRRKELVRKLLQTSGSDTSAAHIAATVEGKLRNLKIEYDYNETLILLAEAARLGIELPEGKEGWYYSESGYESLLTGLGQIRARRLLRDERRKNVEWWVRVIGPVLTVLVGLLGLLVALLSLLYKIR